MADYFQRLRDAIAQLGGGRPPQADAPSARGSGAEAQVVTTDGRAAFADAQAAASSPGSWLALFSTAASHQIPVDRKALDIIERRAGHYDASAMVIRHAGPALRQLLTPAPGFAQRLGDFSSCGLWSKLIPEIPPPGTRARAALAALERLLTSGGPSADRFGTMLRELPEPDLVVAALAAREALSAKTESEQAGPLSAAIATRLGLDEDARANLEFLLRHHAQMGHVAFRRDIGDPEVVHAFASSFASEDQLKMLCLMTVADVATRGADAVTLPQMDVVWRLFVDAYNDLTMGYADDVIEGGEGVLAALRKDRPADVSEAELGSFLEGLPRRYLTLFPREEIYRHVVLARNLTEDTLHCEVRQQGSAWELTIVTLDKPFLFSTVCGVLAYLNLDILRGHALTSLKSVVIDVFEFADPGGLSAASKVASLVEDAIRGRVDIRARLLERDGRAAAGRPGASPPVLYFDRDSSRRYTILEVVAEDAPGLLHRVSRAISLQGCDVELVVISTEGHKAVDVFHLRKGDAKLSDADELALTEELERAF